LGGKSQSKQDENRIARKGPVIRAKKSEKLFTVGLPRESHFQKKEGSELGKAPPTLKDGEGKRASSFYPWRQQRKHQGGKAVRFWGREEGKA